VSLILKSGSQVLLCRFQERLVVAKHSPVTPHQFFARTEPFASLDQVDCARQPAWLVVLLGGPALFLAGHALFQRAMFDQWPPSHLVALLILAALAVLAVLAPVMLQTPSLVVAGASTMLLIGAAAAHTVTQRTPSTRGEVARTKSTEGS
jgi:hypothetical protein